MPRGVGRIIGLLIGRRAVETFGPAHASIGLGAILVFCGIGLGISLLLAISSGNKVFTEDKQLWGTDFIAKVVEKGEGYTVVDYKYGEDTGRAEVPGSPVERDSDDLLFNLPGLPGNASQNNLVVYYDPFEPSQVSQEFISGWIRAYDATVVEIRDDSFIIEYRYEKRMMGTLHGTQGEREAPGSRVMVRYELADPSNIARDLWSFWNDVMVAGFPIIFGTVFLLVGFFLLKKAKR